MLPGSQEEACRQKPHQGVGKHEADRGRRLYADPPTEAASPSMESIATKRHAVGHVVVVEGGRG